ncbi:MAG TPA: toll/interleukin-1 receptor domain-containing protein [Acidobacteriota bacterium]|nr:toll/interleukin-1 receptor domain-containing protein [Acidobacteriota bacterium]
MISLSDVAGAHLKGVVLARTVIVSVDLGVARGLEDIEHLAPSSLSTDTLTRSRGGIAAAFLRGCGLTDIDIEAANLSRPGIPSEEVTEIAYNIINLKTARPLATGGVFISYAPDDSEFVDAVASHLDARGVRYWRNARGLKPLRAERQTQRWVRAHDCVLLVLSKHSVNNDWVEREVAEANKLSRSRDTDVLCPIALDEAWKTCDWPGPILRRMKDHEVLDFSDWRDPAEFSPSCERLIDALPIFQAASREEGHLSADRRPDPDATRS